MTFEELEKDVEPYLNTLVLDMFKIVKLVGVTKDTLDYYYRFIDLKDGEYHSSILISMTPLKGLIRQRDYDHLVGVWNMNVDRTREIYTAI